VFIRRRGSGVARYLANEADLEKRLEQRGFEIVDPASQTTDEIVRRVRDAAIICGVEGSALVHGVLSMAADAALVVIQPPYRFSNIWKDYCDALNIKYAYIVVIGDEDSFFIPFEEIMRTIDLVS
jgi:capsular polysaccharide biosynthesis protein